MEAVELARWRMHTVRLTGAPFATPEEVVGWLTAVQSQDYAPAVWAVGQRLNGVTDAVVDTAFAEGGVLRTHVLRPTWHFVLPDDIRWLLALTGPRVHALNAPLYRQEGLDAATRVRTEPIIERALAGGRQLTRVELAERLAADGVEAQRFRLAYILMHAELEGLICSGTMRGKQHTYALLDERAPGGRTLTRDDALAELVLRYFTSHGPATVKDCTTWASLTMADVRAGLEQVGDRLESVEAHGMTFWAAPRESVPEAPSPRVRMLQGYDEYIVGYTQSKPLLDLADRANAMRGRPVANGVLLLDTQVAGHWKRTISASRVIVEVALYRPFDAAETAALHAEVESHGRFLDRTAEVVTRLL